MTIQNPIQPSTFADFGSFPSAEGHRYTSVSTSVAVIEDPDFPQFVEMEALIEIAFGGSVVGVPFRTYGSIENGTVTVGDPDGQRLAMADLEFLKEKFDEFYTEAKRAFSEFPVG